jgi:hypothetical protein
MVLPEEAGEVLRELLPVVRVLPVAPHSREVWRLRVDLLDLIRVPFLLIHMQVEVFLQRVVREVLVVMLARVVRVAPVLWVLLVLPVQLV